MKSYFYSLGPPTWDTDHWRAPDAASGMIDLRGIPACGEAGTFVNRQLAMCWFLDAAAVPESHTQLNAVAGDVREIPVDSAMVAKFESRTGITFADPSQYSSLASLVLDLFTNRSDPNADDSVPTLESETIHFAGHSPIISLPKDWKSLNGFSAYTDRLLNRQRQKVSKWLASEKPEVAQKALGGLLIRNGETGQGRGKDRTWREDQWQRFVSPQDRATVRRMGGPKPPETDLSDDFSSGTLANWAGDTADCSVTGGVCQWNDVGASHFSYRIYFNTALSSDDMWSQVQHVAYESGETLYRGPAIRCNAAARTLYCLARAEGTDLLWFHKVVAGSYTSLSILNYGPTYATGMVDKADVSGSTLSGYANGTLVCTGTDSAISGYLYAGTARIYYSSAWWKFDNFSASDGLGGGSAFTGIRIPSRGIGIPSTGIGVWR